MAVGDFTASELQVIRLKAEQFYKDNTALYTPEANSAIAVLENQTARFKAFENVDKDVKVAVTWLDACGIEAKDCEETCDIEEDEIESKKKEYEPNICKSAGFSLDSRKLRTNDYTGDEIIMDGLNASIKALDEFWAKQLLVKLKTFTGVNVAPQPFTFEAALKTTLVPEANYNLKLLAHWVQQSKLNRIANPYFIDNGSLFIEMLNARFQAGNADGAGDASRLAQLSKLLYDDQFNFAAAGLTEDTFLIGKNAVAFQTVNKVKDQPTVIGGKVQVTTYTVKSLVLPNVKYDVEYTVVCKVVGGKRTYVHTWRLTTNGLIELNPQGCPVVLGAQTVTPTGVLSYTKNAVVTP